MRRITNKVVFYPMLSRMAGNPYWTLLASGLKDVGVEVVEEPDCYKIGWLFKHRNLIDIIHFHYFQSLYCNSGHTRARLIYVLRLALYLILARLLGYRTVLTLHNLEPTNALKPAWVDYLGHWVAVNLTERVIVHCKEARRLLHAMYGRKHHVFEVGHPNYFLSYPNDISREKARFYLDLTPDKHVFLFFGGVRPNKNIESLIQAFRQIEGSQYSLVISGNPGNNVEYASILRNLAEGDQRILFQLQFILDEQIQIYFNACDVVVLPFAHVLTSGSAILAMSYARPVIAPRAGCLPELLEPDSGWLYEAGELNSLIEVMKSSIKQDFVRAGLNGFKKISACSVSNFIKQTLECYGMYQATGSKALQ
jgi:glycosyltransferase involved in cell wall biosynthesis